MAAYLPLFSVEVEHGFFADAACRDLTLTPSPASARLLGNTGCLMRPLRNGVAVAFDTAAADALRLQAADAQEPMCLSFAARIGDAGFAHYTEATAAAGAAMPSLLLFDSDRAVAEDDGRWRLHEAPQAGPADRVPVDAPGLHEPLTRWRRHQPPPFVLQVRVRPGDLQAPPPDGRRYVLRFQARRTVWKYYLVGEWAQDEMTVVDLGSETAFEAPRPDRLADGRAAFVTRSQGRISLQERPAQRFQLRGRSGGTERVLVKRLPAAAPGQLGVETIGGVPTPVSEIFVHR
jgi:hypothetical protein